ncbi:MAG TPA: Tad domain-containing protein [Polyangia bacterium]|jgi:Flp pilus assembly protein TadG
MRNGAPKRTRPRDGGAIAVVAAVALVALIGMAALVVDGGYLAMRRRGLQGVADAAALAGGYSLPASATAIAQAKANATANGYTNATNGATVTVNSPYSSDSRKIEVIVQTNPSTFLGTALRINAGVVKGRAVATLPAAPDTVFAGDTACSTSTSCSVALCINGTSFHTTGSIHSNGSLMFSGDSSDSMGATEYGGGCAHSVNGAVAVASGPTQVATDAYPLPYTATSDFSPCTYSKSGTFDVSQPGAWWQSGNSSSGGVLRSGTYCATGGGIQLNGSNITGSVTFVCDGVIQISGQSINLTSYSNDVFLFTTSAASPAVVIGSYNLQWEGAIFAPNGAINISGTQFIVNGSIIGKDVFLGATNWTMTGSSGTSIPYLTE